MKGKGTTVVTAYVLCWLAGWAAGLAATLAPSYLQAIAQTFFDTSSTEASGNVGAWLQTAFLGGQIIGGVLLGFTSDRINRFVTMAIAVLFCIGALFLMTLMPTLELAALMRMFSGMGAGGCLVLGATIGREIIPAKRQPLLMGVMANSYAVGIVCMGAMRSMIPVWQTAATLSSVCLVIVPLLILMRHRQKTIADGHGHTDTDDHASTEFPWSPALQGMVLFGCMLIGLWTVFTWLPAWAQQVHGAKEGLSGIAGTTTMSLGMGGIIGSLFTGIVAKRFHPLAIMISCNAVCVVMVIVSTMTGTPSAAMFPLISLFFALAFGVSQGVLTYYIPTLFPRRWRGTGVGMSFNAGRLLTMIALFVGGTFLISVGGFRNALQFGLLPFGAGLVSAFFILHRQGATPVELGRQGAS